MNLLQKLRNYFGGPNAAEEFFKAFELTAKTRGCVCFFQDVNDVVNYGAFVERLATEGVTTKLVLLPGDPYPLVNKKNLVAFEPLNRNFRRDLLKIRNNGKAN